MKTPRDTCYPVTSMKLLCLLQYNIGLFYQFLLSRSNFIVVIKHSRLVKCAAIILRKSVYREKQ